MKKMKKYFFHIGMGVCIIAGVLAIVYYSVHVFQTQENDRQINVLQNVAHSKGSEKQESGQDQSNTSAETESSKDSINFQGLRKINPEVEAWITIPGTVIDYPVMLSSEENAYLHKDIYQKSSSHGMLYFAKPYDRENEQWNMLIYGHNMKNGSMFGSLLSYRDQKYREKHPVVHLYRRDQMMIYRVVGAFITDVSGRKENCFRYSRYLTMADKSSFRKFMHHYDQCKLYDLQEKLEKKDRLLMLSTCEYSTSDGRFVLLCRQEK